MRALITGATGFLGERLTLRLLDEGIAVRVLVRSADRASRLAARGADVIEGDVTDSRSLDDAIVGATVVFHLAGKLYIPGVPDQVYRETHVEGTRHVLAAVERSGEVERLIHCSTTGVLGITGEAPASEDAPFAPTNTYEATKRDAEVLVRDAVARGVPAVIVRPGLVYGPGDLHLLGFFHSIQRGWFRPIGNDTVWLHPIYIDDMTEAFMRCAICPRAVGECFHIAGQQRVTLADLAKLIALAIGVRPSHGVIPLRAARAAAAAGDLVPARLRAYAPLTRSRLDFLTHSRSYDVAKAASLLNFVAQTELAEGIARTVLWYREAGFLPFA